MFIEDTIKDEANVRSISGTENIFKILTRHKTFKIHLAFELGLFGIALMVLEHTSYVPSGTTIAFMTTSNFLSGFQSSHDTSKSSANLRQNPIRYQNL